MQLTQQLELFVKKASVLPQTTSAPPRWKSYRWGVPKLLWVFTHTILGSSHRYIPIKILFFFLPDVGLSLQGRDATLRHFFSLISPYSYYSFFVYSTPFYLLLGRLVINNTPTWTKYHSSTSHKLLEQHWLTGRMFVSFCELHSKWIRGEFIRIDT